MIELLIVLLPLLGSIIAGVFVKRDVLSQFISTLLMIVSAILSWYVFLKFDHVYYLRLFSWLKIDGLTVDWGIYVDSLTAIMLIVVTTVSAVVHVYSIGYMEHEDGKGRFFSYLSLFTFFMIVLVVSNNFVQMFVGWEGVGLCSYLLIGFWFQKFSANKAAMKAFVVNRVGDFCLLLALFIIFWHFGSLNFDHVFKSAPDLRSELIFDCFTC